MRVSIINLNLVGHDAIGQSILNQIRFFRRRGDSVRVYVQQGVDNIPEDVDDLVVMPGSPSGAAADTHFATSDLYVYHYPSRYDLIDTIATRERGAVILYYHNVTPPDLWQSSFAREVLEDSIASLARYAGYADLIVTDSEYNAEQLVSEHGIDQERVRVLPLAVPLDQFRPGPKDAALLARLSLYGRPVILFVGRMAANKRVDLLVQALPLVQQHVPQAVLLLVGDERSNPAIAEHVAVARARAVALQAERDVVFTGTVDDLAEYYRLADVYATASLHEGFGVPLLEAMASGIPVVASRSTAHPWVLGDAGLLYEAGNVSELADSIVRVLTDDALHGDLVRRGLERVRDFSVEAYEIGWARIVSEAASWLPSQPYPTMRSVQLRPVPAKEPPVGLAQEGVVTAAPRSRMSLDALQMAADVMQRGYHVQSHVPVIGPLIAWIRRNLTSHLREPYLDPTLERQVKFNQLLVQELHDLQQQVRELAMRAQQLEQGITVSIAGSQRNDSEVGRGDSRKESINPKGESEGTQ